LISAIDNFDPSHNVKLKTYAEYKIPRSNPGQSPRARLGRPAKNAAEAKQIEAAIASAEQKLQRLPSEEEISIVLGISIDEYQSVACGNSRD
jgi:RNA polymerase sigma factor for flagellar operon FliA